MTLRVTERHEFVGEWWTIGEHEDEDLHGTLTFEPRELITLETTGELHDWPFDSDDRRNILGISRKGKKITILNAWTGATTFNFPGMAIRQYNGHETLVGIHTEELDPIFHAMKIGLSGLTDWVDPPQVELSGFKDFFKKKAATFTIKPPETQSTLHVPSLDAEVSIVVDVKVKPGRQSMNYESNVNLIVEPSDPMELSWFRRIVRKFRLFFWLMEGYQVHLDFASVSQGKVEGSDGNEYYNFQPYLTAHERLVPKKVRHKFLMAIQYEGVKNQLAEMLNRWIHDFERIRPLVDLYFAAIERPSQYIQFRILSMTAGLEGYHRNVHGGGYMGDDEWKPIRRKIRESVPDELSSEHKGSIREALHWAHQYSLRTRLTALLDGLEEGELARITHDRDWLVSNAKRTRDFTAHYDPTKVTLDDMALIAHQLEAFCVVILWQHIGIPDALRTQGLERMGFKDQTATEDKSG